jgi:archaellum component FlaC
MSKKTMTQPQQRVALDMIMTQPDHGGMSEAAILLHKKQAEDAEKMEKRMSDIEKKVDSLDKKVDNIDKKMDEIKSLVEKNSSFKQNLKDMLSNKVFLYLLFILMCLLVGKPIAESGLILLGK